jgi:diguanylate cyclase (GGDEF)-like protein
VTYLGNNSHRGGHILILEDSQGRRTIPLEESKYSIGRQPGNDIVLQSKQASRKHATLVRKTSSSSNRYAYWILDGDLEGNKSHNGIFINGDKCLIHELKNGDLINFGCEVNASYHLLSNMAETSVNPEPSKDTLERLAIPKVSNLHQKSTLILSDPHLTSAVEDTLQDQAYLDPLTELPNRSLFNEYLSIAMGNAKRNQKPLGILMFDIEKLRIINDKFSYSIGDKILQNFSIFLKSCLRSADIVARWGGDEFTILLPQISAAEDAPKICQRIVKNLKEPLTIEQYQILLNINLGFAVYPQDGYEGLILIKKAEANLEHYKQQNKHQSKHKTRIQKDTVHAQTTKLSKVEALIRQALNQQQFSLDYQPEVNIRTGEIEGIEALLRWHHPQHGLIAPNQFIPWIEKTDLTMPISKWILETACNQSKAWQEIGLGVIPLSINFSCKQLQQPHLLQMLGQIMGDRGVKGNSIIIEITEQSLLENTEDTFRILHELKQLGIKIALDDFGTGYTSVSHLQQFTFDKLKIAQSLIHILKHNPEDTTMISAVIALARTFNLQVVAEGIETQKQLDILRQLQCEVMQGYRFTQPLNAKDMTQFLFLHRTMSLEQKESHL